LFNFTQYEVVLKVEEPLALPAYKGSILRGNFGATLKRLCCANDFSRCDAKPPTCQCPYGFLFEPKTPANNPHVRAGSEVARPFVIEPPPDAKRDYGVGETITFRLTLFGAASQHLPYFLVTLRELPRMGAPRQRGRVSLDEIWAVNDVAGVKQRVYFSADRLVRSAEQPITFDDVAATAAHYPTDRLTLHFQTNTILQYQSQTLHRIEFHALISRLLQRLETIAALYGDREASYQLALPAPALIRAAKAVTIADDRTRWNVWSRYSRRQEQKIPMDGVIGNITYTGDLAPFLPLLLIGQYTHVGKGCVFGLGKFFVLR
jgi:hypothetical protein